MTRVLGLIGLVIAMAIGFYLYTKSGANGVVGCWERPARELPLT